MIRSSILLGDLRSVLRRLEEDIRARAGQVPAVHAQLQARYDAARAARRTAEAFAVWRDDQVTQAAVAWILGCVFVRFMEDNGLVPEPWLSGPGDRLARARDQHTHYFRQNPRETDREYLLHVFGEVRRLPAVAELFDEKHNPIWQLQPSGDGAGLLLRTFQAVDASRGGLNHDFTDPDWNTRFLGDLYQDLSEPARKRYALLQTPDFIQEFILDRTLTPAIAAFGIRHVRMIDCTCGSGHFLLGGFRRILEEWLRAEPGTNVRELVQRALGAVYGVDLNPYAVAIARFRLLVAALNACGVKRLRDAPNFRLNLAAGDALLHGRRFRAFESAVGAQRTFDTGDDLFRDELKHHYDVEDLDALHRILGQQYHAVVGNPPYITVKDRALNEAYRARFDSCHQKYSLAVPFMERFFDLAIEADPEARVPAGHVGMITTNAFMKREFGKRLVERFIPRWDLTHVIDTAGAYIPGHGTPTVILLGKHQPPVAPTIRTVMGIKGEPSTPADPARGLVWTAILRQVDQPGAQSPFVSVADTDRSSFHKHPWSIGGGGAAELKERLDNAGLAILNSRVDSIGFASFTGQDDAFTAGRPALLRASIPHEYVRAFVTGDTVRDWAIESRECAFAPYGEGFDPIVLLPESAWARWLWPVRTAIVSVGSFGGKTRLECGDNWWTWYRWVADRYRTPLSIVFGEVATHNHFVLDRGGKVFNRTAPVMKLPAEATEADHFALLGLLNSSVACFWLKQVCQNKGSTVDERGARQRTAQFEDFYQFNGTNLASFPLPAEKPLPLAQAVDSLAQEMQTHAPAAVLVAPDRRTRGALDAARDACSATLRRMIALQEELDWECYRLYGLLDDDLCYRAGDVPAVRLGERAFEIGMARQMAAGALETTWFTRHGSTPITDLPAHWPDGYRRLVERRIAIIGADRDIGLIERPEYKRRWNVEPWDQRLERALREWLLARLEDRRYWARIEVTSAAVLADQARVDAEFMRVAELFRGRPDFDVTELVMELVEAEGVPILPADRYRPSGLRKREVWEEVWERQRREDAIDAEVGVDAPEVTGAESLARKARAKQLKRARIGDIPVPPRYASGDFRKPAYWRLRGKLDVPKERFVLFPGCERDADPTPALAWAGWDHLQQARAIAGYHEQVRNEGWSDDRRMPLLAAVLELVPWLRQWYNQLDPACGMGLGEFFEDFVKTEARAMGKTLEDVRRIGKGPLDGH